MEVVVRGVVKEILWEVVEKGKVVSSGGEGVVW